MTKEIYTLPSGTPATLGGVQVSKGKILLLCNCGALHRNEDGKWELRNGGGCGCGGKR